MYTEAMLNDRSNFGPLIQWFEGVSVNIYTTCPGCGECLGAGVQVMQRRRSRTEPYDMWLCCKCFKKYVEDVPFEKEVREDHPLHVVWTKAVGTERYVKDEWLALEKLVWDGINARRKNKK